MTTLTKQISTTYTPGTPGSPGDPGVAGHPAYYAYVTTDAGYWVNTSAGAYGSLGTDVGIGGRGGGGQWVWVSVPRTVLTYFPAVGDVPPTPAVAPTPSQTLMDYNLGWTGRADSITTLTGDGYYTFTIPLTDVGVVAGLSPVPQTSGYTDIMFGFYSSHGVAQVYENGISVYTYGAHTASNVFKIRRRAGKVDYLIDGTVIYSSLYPVFTSPLSLTAALYSGGDSVVGAAMGLENGSVSSMLPPAAQGRVGPCQASAQAQAPCAHAPCRPHCRSRRQRRRLAVSTSFTPASRSVLAGGGAGGTAPAPVRPPQHRISTGTGVGVWRCWQGGRKNQARRG